MSRPYRANRGGMPNPRALPWAGMARTVGAENHPRGPLFHDTVAPHPAADTSALEREIDQQVYALHGLTPEEIAIVEGTAN